MNRDLSVITVCMNRQHHLLASAQRVAAWPHHQEHLVLDWSSHDPLKRSQLPDDPRIRLERVEGEERWNLCRAYNFAAQLARGSLLLKLDADCWPEDLDPVAYFADGYERCWFGSGLDGRLGQFLMARESFEAVGGLNEVLVGYGFDDKDLKARLQSLNYSVQLMPEASIGVIPHSIHERVSRSQAPQLKSTALENSLSFALHRATAMSNRVAAAHMPWTAQRSGSRYECVAAGLWRCDPSTIPKFDGLAAAELKHLRRQVFWSRFLELPDLHVKMLPVKLLPPDHEGNFAIRSWHWLYWHTLRRLLRIPVDLLVLFKGCLRRPHP